MKRKFRTQLLACMLVAFVVIFVATFLVQTKVSEASAEKILAHKAEDTQSLLQQTAQRHELVVENFISSTLAKVDALALIYKYGEEHIAEEGLWDSVRELLDVDEVNITDENGIIIYSTSPGNLGYDFHKSEQTSEFLPVLEDPSLRVIQGVQPRGIDGKSVMYAGGARLDPLKSGIVEIGVLPERFEELNNIGDLSSLSPALQIGNTGTTLICNLEGIVRASADASQVGESLFDHGFDKSMLESKSGKNTGKYWEKSQICIYSRVDGFYSEDALRYMDVEPTGYYLVSLLPTAEVYAGRNISCAILLGTTCFLFILVYVAVAFLVQRQVISGIYQVNRRLAQITGGDLAVRIDVENNEEFRQLSTGINTTVDALKEHIEREKLHIQRELELAGRIQASALPQPEVLRCVPEVKIFAFMCPAKDVGGDFYDFFLLGEDEVAFLIADVSGKGIAAALFMMRVKGEVKGQLLQGLPLQEALTRVGANLCEHNDEMMFATLFAAIFNRKTGEISYVNAGHNPPILLRDGTTEAVKDPPCLLLAALPDVSYKAQKRQLKKGDLLVLYTDGISEALNEQDQFYGMGWLKTMAVEQSGTPTVQQVGEQILAELREFMGNAEQADDITLLVFQWKGETDE